MKKLLLMFLFLQFTSVLKCPQQQEFVKLITDIQSKFDSESVSCSKITNEQVARITNEQVAREIINILSEIYNAYEQKKSTGPDGFVFTSELPFWRTVIFGLLFDFVTEFFELLNHNTSLSLKQNLLNALICIIEKKKIEEKVLDVRFINLLSELKTLQATFAAHTLGTGACAGGELLPVFVSHPEGEPLPPSSVDARNPMEGSLQPPAPVDAFTHRRRVGSPAVPALPKEIETQEQRDQRLEEAAGINLSRFKEDIKALAIDRQTKSFEYSRALWELYVASRRHWFKCQDNDWNDGKCFWSGCDQEVTSLNDHFIKIFCEQHFSCKIKFGYKELHLSRITKELLISFLQKTYSEESIEALKNKEIETWESYSKAVLGENRLYLLYKDNVKKLFYYCFRRFGDNLKPHEDFTQNVCMFKDCQRTISVFDWPFCRVCYHKHNIETDPFFHSQFRPIFKLI